MKEKNSAFGHPFATDNSFEDHCVSCFYIAYISSLYVESLFGIMRKRFKSFFFRKALKIIRKNLV